ncbi:divalent-cation tolerance protein CutA [Streptosporangium sp. V21-05]|uniref:divalent-cation tolerance protein CutA n=1 Tax=Streptosporangium sp. V21-05 TaxID=3446115 RepID=UPI003F533B89
MDYIQVITTVPTSEGGATLAHSITDARLAAGVQITGPIRSVYWWRGSLEDREEWQLTIVTTSACFAELEEHIKARHDYVTPEIIAIPVVSGSSDYLSWISTETKKTDASS